MSRQRGGPVAVGAILLALAAVAITLHAVAAALQSTADAYFATVSLDGSVVVDQLEFERYNDLSILAGTLTAIAAPLLAVVVAGTFLLLAVVGQRWDVAHRRKADATLE